MKSKEHESCEMTHYDLAEALRDAHQEILDFRLNLQNTSGLNPPSGSARELNERVKGAGRGGLLS